MAAQLDITYTPQYLGCHRICFRTNQAQYCCYLDTSSSVIGTPKTVSLALDNFAECLVFVPEEISCTGTTPVTGYIQPCCSDENSNDNRVAFTASFVSTPCTPYTIECFESGVGEIAITNPGYGWPIGVVPNIIVNTTGSGTGFTATAIMQCLPGDNFCSIDDIDITDPGEGYYYINELSVEVVPMPTCISNELITNGDFATDLSGWTQAPSFAPNIFTWSASQANYNNIAYGNTTPGFISQNILTPGRTYEIRIDSLTLGCSSGYVQFIVTAGDFDISGTQPNQFNILRFSTDPIYTTPISVTLTCVGSSSFNIYAYSTDISNVARINFSDVSVIEVCTVIDPVLEVSVLDDCGTFTVPNCDGTANATQYGILGGPDYVINVCAGDAGPVGPKYYIQAEVPGTSCCECKLYNVVVRNPIDIYYTNCNQTIDVVSVEAGAIGVTVCAIPGSVWPANKLDNVEILAITEVGDCIPTE